MRNNLQPGIRDVQRYVVSSDKTVPVLYPEAGKFLAMAGVCATGFIGDLIARARHERFIVQRAKFDAKVYAKQLTVTAICMACIRKVRV